MKIRNTLLASLAILAILTGTSFAKDVKNQEQNKAYDQQNQVTKQDNNKKVKKQGNNKKVKKQGNNKSKYVNNRFERGKTKPSDNK